MPRPTYRLTNVALHPDHSLISARIGGKEIAARIGVPGRHIVQNALAVLGAAHLVGADVEKVALSLESLSAEPGRGKRHVLKHPDGAITLIDESYNANPASMKAAMALLDATPVSGEGRRIAVLGDMLELGSHSAKLHSALAGLIAGTRTDLILLAGPEMKSLAEALPEERQGGVQGRRRGFEAGADRHRAARRRRHDQVVQGHRLLEARRCAHSASFRPTPATPSRPDLVRGD